MKKTAKPDLEAKISAELDAEIEANKKYLTSEMKIYARIADDEAAQKGRDESLRIALITNEINAGRVSEIAGIYRKFLVTHSEDSFMGFERTWCSSHRVKALEHAAKIGYVSPEETVEAAEEFAKHLSGQNERGAS